MLVILKAEVLATPRCTFISHFRRHIRPFSARHSRSSSSRLVSSSYSENGESMFSKHAGILLFGGLVAGTVTLGTWQTYRYSWKVSLMEHKRKEIGKNAEILPFQKPLDGTLTNYRRFIVSGRFIPGEEFIVEPRSPPKISLKNAKGITKIGACVFTLFERSDVPKGECSTILVNRGMVTHNEKDRLPLLFDSGERSMVVVASRQDKPGFFAPKNSPAELQFRWQDIEGDVHCYGYA